MAALVDRSVSATPAEHMPVIYEWLVEGTSQSGTCSTEHAAMQALSQILLQVGYGFGVVRPLEWLDVAQLGERYLPCNPLYRARCEHGVIWWC